MQYKKVYALYERHSKDGEFWFKSAGKRLDVAISDEWYKVNDIRNRRLKELKTLAESTNNFKSQDFCDENYSILFKDGMLIELIIETKYFS
jgi:hypothetical protein